MPGPRTQAFGGHLVQRHPAHATRLAARDGRPQSLRSRPHPPAASRPGQTSAAASHPRAGVPRRGCLHAGWARSARLASPLRCTPSGRPVPSSATSSRACPRRRSAGRSPCSRARAASALLIASRSTAITSSAIAASTQQSRPARRSCTDGGRSVLARRRLDGGQDPGPHAVRRRCGGRLQRVDRRADLADRLVKVLDRARVPARAPPGRRPGAATLSSRIPVANRRWITRSCRSRAIRSRSAYSAACSALAALARELERHGGLPGEPAEHVLRLVGEPGVPPAAATRSTRRPSPRPCAAGPAGSGRTRLAGCRACGPRVARRVGDAQGLPGADDHARQRTPPEGAGGRSRAWPRPRRRPRRRARRRAAARSSPARRRPAHGRAPR